MASTTTWMARAVQAVVTAVLITAFLSWMSRNAWRRRNLADGVPGGRLVRYPGWVTWLGAVVCGAMCLFAWFAAHAPPERGGNWRTVSIFIAFALLGAAVGIGARADTFVVSESALERRRFGRTRRIAWGDLVRLATPMGGQGLRLVATDGTRLDVATLMDGFGVLCDALLLHAPAAVRVDDGLAPLVVMSATLDPAALQHAYARWFEREPLAPPPGTSPTEIAIAAGGTFVERLVARHGSCVPFEARVDATGRLRITHGEPRGDDPGFAAFRTDGEELVLRTDGGEQRYPLRGT